MTKNTLIVIGFLLGAVAVAGVALTLAPDRFSPGAALNGSEATEFAEATALVESLELGFETFELPNGLTVLAYPSERASAVLVGVWYRVGSKDEPEGRSGFAHLFEHLMFQQTANRSGEYFDLLEAAGAIDINGTTSADRTNYYQLVPPAALDLALWLESDRMQYLPGGITQAVLDEQRAVVMNEKRESESGDDFLEQTIMMRALFPVGHPYDHTVIGSMDDIEAATLDDVSEWFDQYYGASNAVLVVAGRFDMDEARAKIEHYFGDVDPGRRVMAIDEWVPTLDENRQLVRHADQTNVSVTRIWPMPGIDSEDVALTMALLSIVERDGENGLLYQTLVEDEGVLTDIGLDLNAQTVSSELALTYDIAPGVAVEEAEDRVADLLAQWLHEGVGEEALRRHVLESQYNLVAILEDPMSIGEMLVEGELYFDDPLYFKSHLALLAEAAPSDLSAAAARWMERPYLEMVTFPAPERREAEGLVDRVSPPSPSEAERPLDFPPFSSRILPNGLTLTVVENDELPLVRGSIRFRLTSDTESAQPEDTFWHVLDFMGAGTENLSPDEMINRSADLDIYPYPFPEDRTVSFDFATTTPRFEPIFQLLADAIVYPNFPQDAIDEALEDFDAELEAADPEDLNALESPLEDLFFQALWGPEHPRGEIQPWYERPTYSREDMVRYHQEHFAPANMEILLVGDVSFEEAEALVTSRFGSWRSDLQPAAAGVPQEPDQPRPRIILYDEPGATQTSVLAGHFVAAYDPDTAPLYDVTNSVLGGNFGSRLNLNLREDKGWTYGVGSSVSGESVGPRVFSISTEVQAEHTAEAIGEIYRELSEFVGNRPLTAEEFERVQRASIEFMNALPLSNSVVLDALKASQDAGLRPDHLEAAPEAYRALTLEQAVAFSHDTYRPDDLVWVLVGDLDVIEADVRALGLFEVEVSDEAGRVVR